MIIRARVTNTTGDAPQRDIEALIRDTDALTEIQNTLRGGCAVHLVSGEVR
ncbi:MAG TPA: hypothetical protein VH497_14620 [Vicinamibacterales bacterium]|jgi:hypothetical protein